MSFASVVGGVFLAFGLGFGALILVLLLAFYGVDTTGYTLRHFGLFQWIYIVPLAWLFKKKQHPGLSSGLLIGGGLTFLLASACNGGL